MSYFHEFIEEEPGDGSRSLEEDWIDVNTTAKENRWSEAETTYRLSEAPPEMREKYRRMKDLNDNKWGSDRKGYVERTNMRTDAETFCDLLEFSDYKRKRVVNIVQQSDMSSNNFGGKQYEKVILAICSLVDDETTDSLDNRCIFTDTFQDLIESVDMDRGEHNRIRQMVRERTNF
jgi:hypothetical protein